MTDDQQIYPLETQRKHEEFHVRYREYSRPRNDAYSVSCETEEDGKVCEAQSLMAEMDLLQDALGYGLPENVKRSLKAKLRQHYVPISAKYVTGVFDECDILPDCGIVSRSASKAIVEKAATSYFNDVVDSGVDAFKILNGDMPDEKVERIFIACGPSKEEVLSGDGYLRPSKELELWSRHYREVLPNVEPA